MKKKSIKKIVITLIICLCLISIMFADEEETAWKGYDMRILNTYDVQIISEETHINVNEDKLLYSGEYIIKNTTDNTIEALIGLPSNDIKNLKLFEKGRSIKYYSRSVNYIDNKYPTEAISEVTKWHTASLWFKAGETKVINVTYETELTNNSKGVYSIRFYKNKDIIQKDTSKTIITLHDFYPYNVLDMFGVSEEKIALTGNNDFLLEMDKNSEIFSIDYEIIDKLAIDRFDFSSDKKLKSIAANFRNKDYNSVNILSEEYLNNPTDPDFSMSQINYIIAEAYRKQADFANYIKYIKKLDFNLLYPNRLKYKILYDLDNIANNYLEDHTLLEILKNLQNQAIEENEYIASWMESIGKNYIVNSEEVKSEAPEEDIKRESYIDEIINYFKQVSIFEKIFSFKYLEIILMVLSFILGYFLGRRKRKKKNTISYYKF